MKEFDSTFKALKQVQDILKDTGLMSREEEHKLKKSSETAPETFEDQIAQARLSKEFDENLSPSELAAAKRQEALDRKKGTSSQTQERGGFHRPEPKNLPTSAKTGRTPLQIRADNMIADIERDHNYSLEIAVSDDKMTAWLSGRVARPWEETDSVLYRKKLDEALSLHRIRAGIQEDRLKAIIELIAKGKSFEMEMIAEGTPVFAGRDAQILLYFDPNESVIGSDDSLDEDVDLDTIPDPVDEKKLDFQDQVDFHDVTRICMATEGQVLAEFVPHVPGKPGFNVLGETLKPSEVDSRDLKAGRNCTLNSEGQIVADRDGRILFNGTTVTVSQLYRVSGNVGYGVGNIAFNADVQVMGDVQSGFKVTADGSVKIMGTVENAEVVAGHNITILGGFAGGEEGKLKSDGLIRISHARGGLIDAGTDLTIMKELINSSVLVGRNLNCAKGSSIIGGQLFIQNHCNAFNLGSSLGVATQIHMGPHSLIFQKMKRLTTVFEHLQENLDALNVSKIRAKTLSVSHEEKEKLRMQLDSAIETLQAEKEAISEQLNELQEELKKYRPIYLRIAGAVYPGVKIVFGQHQFDIIEPFKQVEFYLHPVQQKICYRALKTS